MTQQEETILQFLSDNIRFDALHGTNLDFFHWLTECGTKPYVTDDTLSITQHWRVHTFDGGPELITAKITVRPKVRWLFEQVFVAFEASTAICDHPVYSLACYGRYPTWFPRFYEKAFYLEDFRAWRAESYSKRSLREFLLHNSERLGRYQLRVMKPVTS